MRANSETFLAGLVLLDQEGVFVACKVLCFRIADSVFEAEALAI